MKFIQYLIAVIIVFTVIAWTSGWFDDLNKQSEIDVVMTSVKDAATNAVDAIAKDAADAMVAADNMASDAAVGAEVGVVSVMSDLEASSGVEVSGSAINVDDVATARADAINTGDVVKNAVGEVAKDMGGEEATKQTEMFTQ